MSLWWLANLGGGASSGTGFSQADITGINQPQYLNGTMYLSWTSIAPPGTWYQVYIDGALAWWGQSTLARFPIPTQSPVRIDIGTVGAGNQSVSYAAELPQVANRFAELNWIGGLWESPDLAGFYVYGSSSPTSFSDGGFGDYGFGSGGFGIGGLASINFTTPLANITAYPGGFTMDGFGLGGFGLGGFGYSSSAYQWISGPLTSGTWAYAVVPYDSAGNTGPPSIASVTICAPPLVPALFPDGTRLHYVWSPITDTVTLTWNSSPG